MTGSSQPLRPSQGSECNTNSGARCFCVRSILSPLETLPVMDKIQFSNPIMQTQQARKQQVQQSWKWARWESQSPLFKGFTTGAPCILVTLWFHLLYTSGTPRIHRERQRKQNKQNLVLIGTFTRKCSPLLTVLTDRGFESACAFEHFRCTFQIWL